MASSKNLSDELTALRILNYMSLVIIFTAFFHCSGRFYLFRSILLSVKFIFMMTANPPETEESYIKVHPKACFEGQSVLACIVRLNFY